MKKLLIGLLVLGSISAFAKSKITMDEVPMGTSIKTKKTLDIPKGQDSVILSEDEFHVCQLILLRKDYENARQVEMSTEYKIQDYRKAPYNGYFYFELNNSEVREIGCALRNAHKLSLDTFKEVTLPEANIIH